MIGYIQGKLLKKEEDRILLLANQIGYEVLLPAIVMDGLNQTAIGDEISFYIYYQQTERQPKPVLIGFHLESEKEFFQQFISVEDVGPLKAVKAITLPISEIAAAIESQDINTLRRLKGIGERTAQKIVATLCGKMKKFILPSAAQKPVSADKNFSEPVSEVLISQLGYKYSDARQMIDDAMVRNPAISTPEELFDEIFRKQ
ncbi:MAG: Holliday junction DNA helicase RuvA [Desulfobacteraceae bacterium IS3]|nr:MAG: Holliday junction DNA helicase RuvA [Desulfobacteraceae bacterium IS3]HAO19794.1 Holliday junction DNA helicase RuvA [Desulfobacteraceae bacterium]